MTIAELRDAEQRRLAWRCRRGMLELDIVFQRFIQEAFYALTHEELVALDGLLDLPDNTLWELVKANEAQKSKALDGVISKLNAVSIFATKDC